MNEKSRKLLDEEITRALTDLEYLDDGSEDKLKAAEYIKQLMSIENESESKDFDQKMEKKKNIQAYIKMGVEFIGITLPIGFYAVWLKRGMKFEETGTYTSQTFRTLWSRFKLTK